MMENVVNSSVEAGAERARGDERERAATGAWPRVIHLVIGALASGAIFFYLQFSTDAILDVDGYYHIRWSQLLSEGMRAGVFPPSFPWLPLTTLNPQDYVDHHLFFHILLIPFTWFGDIRLGAKIAAALFGALAVLSCYWLIIRYQIRYAPVWLVALLACSAPFLYRLSMTRAQSVSIIFMVAGIYLLFERRYRLLAPLAFLYVWTYSLFVMLCAAAVIWAVAVWWSERGVESLAEAWAAAGMRKKVSALFSDKGVEWRPLVWTALGTIAGFVINPYFPHNVRLFAEHLVMKVNPNEFSTSVGMEWYPYESWYMFGSSFVAFAATLIGLIAFDWTDRRRAARPLFFLVFSTILMIMTARSRRFVEYWPPFAVLFAAFTLQPLLEGVRRSVATHLSADVMDELQPFLDRHGRPEETNRARRRERWSIAAATIVALILAVPLVVNVHETAKSIASDQTPFAYRGGMEWIRRNVPKGEIIFNTDWDDFPKMFFYDPDHRYVSGLDPTYLLNEAPELSQLYVDVTLGKNNYEAGTVIRDRFGAHYVFSDKEEIHDDFFFKALDSGWFEKVYEDDHCAVLRVRTDKGTPAPDNEGEAVTPGAEANGEDDSNESGEGNEESAPPPEEGQP